MLKKIEYEDELFSKLDAGSLKIQDKTYIDCRFENCKFIGTDFSYSSFEDCLFDNCNLSLTIFNGARLRNAVFENCKLVGVNFKQCDRFIFEVHFKKCLMQSCNFSELKLRNSLFKESRIFECDFVRTKLIGADFKNSYLTDSIFDNSDLSKADFEDAVGYNINPLNNKLVGAKFSMPDVVSLLNVFDLKIKP